MARQNPTPITRGLQPRRGARGDGPADGRVARRRAAVCAVDARQLIASGQTSTTAMAEQKLEQLRGADVGLRPAGQGLPLSRHHDQPDRVSADARRHRAEPVADRLARAEHGRVRRLPRRERRLGRHRHDAAGHGGLHPAVVDSAAADQPEQHAGHPGAGHAGRERSGARRPSAFTRTRMAGDALLDDGQDEESVMSAARPRTRCRRSRLLARRAARLDRDHADGHRRDLRADEPGAGHAQAQPEVADMQQRMRVGIGRCSRN